MAWGARKVVCLCFSCSKHWHIDRKTGKVKQGLEEDADTQKAHLANQRVAAHYAQLADQEC